MDVISAPLGLHQNQQQDHGLLPPPALTDAEISTNLR